MPTRSELFDLAHALGHRDPAIHETRRGRWIATCSCGYESASRVNAQLALEAGIHHALGAARDAINRNSGRRIDELLARKAG